MGHGHLHPYVLWSLSAVCKEEKASSRAKITLSRASVRKCLIHRLSFDPDPVCHARSKRRPRAYLLTTTHPSLTLGIQLTIPKRLADFVSSDGQVMPMSELTHASVGSTR
jgi:hypothetical protein